MHGIREQLEMGKFFFFFHSFFQLTEKNTYSKSLKWAGYAHLMFFPYIFVLHLIARILFTTLLSNCLSKPCCFIPTIFTKGNNFSLTSSFLPQLTKPFQSSVKGRFCTFNKSWTNWQGWQSLKMAELLPLKCIYSPQLAFQNIIGHE